MPALLEHPPLFGLGIGYVDAHLVAATVLTLDARLWARGKRLGAAAVQLGIKQPGDAQMP